MADVENAAAPAAPTTDTQVPPPPPPPEDPNWKPSSGGKYPKGALYCGKDVNHKDLFFARAVKPDGTVWLGKVGQHYQGCWYINTLTNAEELAVNYDVLCIPGDQWKWVSVSFPQPAGVDSDDDEFGTFNIMSDDFSLVPTTSPNAVESIPENAFAPGRDPEGRPLFVARMRYKNVWHAGVAAPHIESGCHIAYAGDQSSRHFQVLVPVEPEDRALQQRKAFLAAVNSSVEAGRNYALVGAEWMLKWLESVRLNNFYVDADHNIPFGELPTKRISNAGIVERSSLDGFSDDDSDDDEAKEGDSKPTEPAKPAKEYTISRHADEYRDYYLVNEEAYALLKQWYSSDLDLVRPAFATTSGASVEFYPIQLKLSRAGDDAQLSEEARTSVRPSWSFEEWAERELLAADAAASQPGDAQEAKEVEITEELLWQRVKVWWYETPLPKGPPQEGEAAAEEAEVTGRWQVLGTKLRSQSFEEFRDKRKSSQGLAELRFALQVLSAEAAAAEQPKLAVETRPWGQFAVGDIIDAQDTDKKWYESLVEAVTQDADGDTVLRVHYLGWSRKYDTNINLVEAKQPRKPGQTYMLAPRNTHTLGIYEKPKPKPKQPPVSYYSSGSYGGYYGGGWGVRSSTKGKPPVPGAVGLVNLGNTCFMNSTLSCLLHAAPMRDFMLAEDKWKSSLNRDSVLGWNGEAAEQYAALVKEYWSNEYSVVAPSSFKEIVGKHKPRFAGFQQQDSSELLSELLDGLDEDLNRVLKKPPTDKIESDGRPDAEVALESWKNHLRRNDSIVQDLFTGQVKSTVDCPDCPRVSVTFDPITYFSVPLPSVSDKRITVYLRPANPDKPMTKYQVKAAQTSFMHHVKRGLADLVNADLAPEDPKLSATALWAGDIWNRKLHRWVDDTSVSRILSNDITVVFEASELDYTPVHPQQAPKLTEEQLANKELASEFAGAALAALIGDDARPVRLQDCLPVALANMIHDDQFGMKSFGGPGMIPVHHKGDRARNCDLWAGIIRAVLPCLSEAALADYHARGRVPFKVLVRESNTLYCGLHPYRRCQCELPMDTEPFQEHMDRYAEGLALDHTFVLLWEDMGAYVNRGFDHTQAAVHPSADPALQKDSALDNGGDDDYGRGGAKNKSTSLDACLDAFTQEEILEESEAWYCSSCRDHKCAKKKFDLWKLPEVMIIHLKRFHYTQAYREKINTLVEFPLEGLNLNKWCKNPEHSDDVYDLFAVSNHSGGMGGGHYTAYVRNAGDGRWYMHNDESVSVMRGGQDVVSSQAYMLFYQRRKKAAPAPAPQAEGERQQPVAVAESPETEL